METYGNIKNCPTRSADKVVQHVGSFQGKRSPVKTERKKIHRSKAPNSVEGRKSMYQIQAAVAMEQ